MKQLFAFLLLFTVSKAALAQAPLQFNYQGVARNAQGQALANQSIKVRVSLLKTDDVNVTTTFYTETRTVTTNALGLFSFRIGDNPTTSTGFITSGNWNDNNTVQSLKVELDVNNSGTWTDMGTQKIVSVPYAMYASEAATARQLSAAPVAFSATSTSYQTIASVVNEKISFESMDPSSFGFNTATSTFTAPTAGFYHFDASVYFTMNAPLQSVKDVYINVQVNGVTKRRFRYAIPTYTDHFNFPISLDIKLATNDAVTLLFENKLSTGVDVGSEMSVVGTTYFNGHLIR